MPPTTRRGADGLDPTCTTMYDTARRVSEERSPPPHTLHSCAGVAYGGYVYSVGGVDKLLGGATAAVSAYSPDHDAWYNAPALPTAGVWSLTCLIPHHRVGLNPHQAPA